MEQAYVQEATHTNGKTDSISNPPLSIAIIGGGIAGLTLTIALLKHAPHLDITLYEAASSFGEIGAGVGFQPNFVQTMNLIDRSIGTAFERCSRGNPETDRWFTVRVGDRKKIIGDKSDHSVLRSEKSGDFRLDDELFVIRQRPGLGRGVHRAHFLDELVKLIPDGVAQFQKRLVNVQKADDESEDAMLSFADGTTARHQAVLGCDGIKSRTRQIVLGDVETAKAVFTGKYAYRGLIPMQKAVDILGEGRTSTSQMYVGQAGHVLTFPIANGKILNVVAFSSKPTWEDQNWVVKASREEMLQDYKDWSPAVQAIVSNMQSSDVWALFNHLPARTYHLEKPAVCLVGDAAHASSPHQGSGAGMCIEDAYIMSGLLAQCRSMMDVQQAFSVFDDVRRPRTQKLVKTSREAGMLWDLEGEGVFDDLRAFEKDATSRMSWIWDHDIAQDLERALQLMQSK